MGDSSSGCMHRCLPWPLTNHPAMASGKSLQTSVSTCSPVCFDILHLSTKLNPDIVYFQVGTDTGYFPSASFAPTCHYVLDTSGPTNMTYDHSHF